MSDPFTTALAYIKQDSVRIIRNGGILGVLVPTALSFLAWHADWRFASGVLATAAGFLFVSVCIVNGVAMHLRNSDPQSEHTTDEQ